MPYTRLPEETCQGEAKARGNMCGRCRPNCRTAQDAQPTILPGAPGPTLCVALCLSDESHLLSLAFEESPATGC